MGISHFSALAVCADTAMAAMPIASVVIFFSAFISISLICCTFLGYENRRGSNGRKSAFADFPAINAIAERHGLPVVEDGAQSFGSEQQGQRSCGLTTIGTTSFFPSKPFGGYGDGGACFTN
ncbi:MAG: hypothetical protein EBZ20_09010, partial [Rhodobacteraceae bacterium]|nr:hypothetical protein [Paracoccaceae bacterium]